MRDPRPLLLAFGLAATVDLGSLAAGFDAGHTVAKPLLMPLLAGYAALSGAPRILVAALLFGWGGDVALLFDAEPAFLLGMASFAAGHVCYLLLFRAPGTHRAFPFLCYSLALTTTVASLWPDLPADLRIPVAGYSLLLTAMAYRAGARFGAVAGAGGALFLLSDTLIAAGVAEWPEPPRPDLWIMLTYIAAQFLLVHGSLRALEARPHPAATYGEVRSTTP
ncbi:lysoplasmalogenase [Streptomyces sp. NPDC048002]|uniref:lysoplasmalogenase n=1 Tax=Streptomyces sp. NPDC048002 TaxID=3154344 RepID=UPI0033FF96FF